MSNVIQFLEAAGCNAALTPVDYVAAVALLEVDDAQRQALLERDHAGLSKLLDGRMKMMCLIVAPDEDAPASVPDDAEVPVPDQDESEPSRQ